MQDVHAQLMREKDEPHEGFSPIPIFLVFAFAALCFWGGLYLVNYSQGFRWDVYDPDYVVDVAPPKPPDLMKIGEKTFKAQCVICHKENGVGIPAHFHRW